MLSSALWLTSYESEVSVTPTPLQFDSVLEWLTGQDSETIYLLYIYLYIYYILFSSVQFSRSVMSDSL